jgi:hypothetical protein
MNSTAKINNAASPAGIIQQYNRLKEMVETAFCGVPHSAGRLQASDAWTKKVNATHMASFQAEE